MTGAQWLRETDSVQTHTTVDPRNRETYRARNTYRQIETDRQTENRQETRWRETDRDRGRHIG